MNVAWLKSRCINALRCYASYALSRFGSVRIAHRPLFLSVEPAATCQLSCPECPVGQANKQRSPRSPQPLMSEEIWQRVLCEAAPYAHTIQFYFQGEPLLNKRLPQMIAQAHEQGLYTIVSTNAQALTPGYAEALVKAGLNRIIISMDGWTDESYNAYRIGGNLQRCKDAIRWLKDAKNSLPFRVKSSARSSVQWTVVEHLLGVGSLIIELQVLRLRTNEQEWNTFRRCYKSLGADRLVFKTAQLYNYASGHPLMPSDPRYSRYILGEDGFYHRRKLPKRCFRVWSGVVITTSGDVLPCCYDKAHAYAYGNIMEHTLAELFASPKAQAFRRAAWIEQPDICKECYK